MDELGRKHAGRIAQIAAAVAVLSLAAAGCGGGGTVAAPTSTSTATGTGTAGGGDQTTTTTSSTAPSQGGGRGGAPGRHPGTSPASEVRGTIEDYISALDHRDGQRLCSLFAPGALDELDLPVQRGGCAASVAASIGYRSRRGFPVWTRSAIGGFHTVTVQGDQARATVTVLTRYADNREPSIEDDVIYLRRSGNRWLLAKPSVTIYRAIGVANVPPQVLAPP